MNDYLPWLTGLKPHSLDLSTKYPMLAMRTVYYQPIHSRSGTRSSIFGINGSLLAGRRIFAKDCYFLTANREGSFKWILSDEASLFHEESSSENPEKIRRRLTRYSAEEEIREDMTVINPIRPFSITSITLEGFDSGKEYPVLAIDVDRYLPEEDPGDGESTEGPQTETMAFFLVGDDDGEFAWVAEDECKLAPLN
jgi:hypothetical protein